MYICCAGPEPFTNERFGMRTVHLHLSYIQIDRKKNEGLNGFWGKKMRIGKVGFLWNATVFSGRFWQSLRVFFSSIYLQGTFSRISKCRLRVTDIVTVSLGILVRGDCCSPKVAHKSFPSALFIKNIVKLIEKWEGNWWYRKSFYICSVNAVISRFKNYKT